MLKESEAGAKTFELCREDGNRRLKRLLADPALEIDALKLIASGNF